MSDKKSFLMYKSWGPIFAELSPEEAGNLVKMIFADQTGEDCDVDASPILKAIFAMMKQTFDENDDRYEEIVKARSEAGKRGGRPRKEPEAEPEKTEKQNKANESNCFLKKQMKAKKAIGEERIGEERIGKDRLGKEEVGEDRDGPEGEEAQRAEELPADPPAAHADLALVLEDGSEWTPDDEYLADLKKAYGCLDVEEEFRRMRLATRGDPKKRRSAAGIKTFVQRWLRNAEKDQTEQPKETRPPNSTARKGFGDFEQRQYDDDFYAALERQAALGGRA